MRDAPSPGHLQARAPSTARASSSCGTSGRPTRPVSARATSVRSGQSSSHAAGADGPISEAEKAAIRMAKLKEAAFHRHANEQMREALEDNNRIFDAKKERKWGEKYRFFSAEHMKASYRTYAKARHDPFNKDPSWGKGVIKRVADAYAKHGVIDPMEMFKGIELSGDGKLTRPMLKKVLVSVLPDISDFEVASIFDTLGKLSGDVNEVSVREFCEALQHGRAAGPGVTKSSGKRWRNPLHRMKRFPPARVEGWDHLEAAKRPDRFDAICDREQREMKERLSDVLGSTPTSARSGAMQSMHRYRYFNGGADDERFLRQIHGHSAGASPCLGDAAFSPTEGGKDPLLVSTSKTYGWLCDPAGLAAYRSICASTPRSRASSAGVANSPVVRGGR
eukprot:TRINITY_DN33452_c0_g1_i1.p1 TRINITY_DN33452_c0_g1~~TRINITY_DN33452_c0_g1_i1.p1  ORF type:complete len:392 (+),score=85.35 TRINITY_DN33452_c0_g1_i1:68-1243(+)